MKVGAREKDIDYNPHVLEASGCHMVNSGKSPDWGKGQ